MRILLTNDDGILAPGLEALYRELAALGRVDVVAPENPQSASGHSVTVRAPITVKRVHVDGAFHGWSVDGRPADCVKLALLELLEERPDFVLSGINAGANTGINVLYSGTVAAAIEAAFFGVPAMAVSLELSTELDFHKAAQIARILFMRLSETPPPPAGTCLNVNIPALDAGWPRGVRVCQQGVVLMDEAYTKQAGPDGQTVYSLDGRMPAVHGTDNCDQAGIAKRYVTITPLRFDLTDHVLLDRLSGWSWPAMPEAIGGLAPS
jgi:5'-nucleotidase